MTCITATLRAACSFAPRAAMQAPGPAAQPEDLGTLFLERANAGDVEGLVALYEPGAVLASDQVLSRGTGRYHSGKRGKR